MSLKALPISLRSWQYICTRYNLHSFQGIPVVCKVCFMLCQDRLGLGETNLQISGECQRQTCQSIFRGRNSLEVRVVLYLKVVAIRRRLRPVSQGTKTYGLRISRPVSSKGKGENRSRLSLAFCWTAGSSSVYFANAFTHNRRMLRSCPAQPTSGITFEPEFDLFALVCTGTWSRNPGRGPGYPELTVPRSVLSGPRHSHSGTDS